MYTKRITKIEQAEEIQKTVLEKYEADIKGLQKPQRNAGLYWGRGRRSYSCTTK